MNPAWSPDGETVALMFWALTHRLRRTALAARAERGDANVVFTNCYSSPHDDAVAAALEREVTDRGARSSRSSSCAAWRSCGVA
ncbi:MAG TPA: hypothetical protein VK858_04500 [Longimicrobiales bacterium]|nr:hypothetical protein [Longimicrobiales bacterium]